MMQLEWWFMFAVLSAVIGGLGAFANKIAAKRDYNAQLVLIFNALTSIIIFLPFALYFEGTAVLSWPLAVVTLLAGVIISITSVIKIQVLHHIDSAIFLPLFKVVGPLIVIVAGIIFFGESFSIVEWTGLTVSLLVPLLLISRLENARQNNLTLGLILIVVCAAISAVAAALHKYATDIKEAPLWIIFGTAIGMLFGSLIQYTYQHQGRIWQAGKRAYTHGVVAVGLMRTIFAGGGFFFTLLAFTHGGELGIVYTINSLYILPPIILAIIFYGEHWNLRKAIAILLSVVALALLG